MNRTECDCQGKKRGYGMNFDALDPIACDLELRRRAGEAEEAKHDCTGCRERFGVPCLKAYKCERVKE